MNIEYTRPQAGACRLTVPNGSALQRLCMKTCLPQQYAATRALKAANLIRNLTVPPTTAIRGMCHRNIRHGAPTDEDLLQCVLHRHQTSQYFAAQCVLTDSDTSYKYPQKQAVDVLTYLPTRSGASLPIRRQRLVDSSPRCCGSGRRTDGSRGENLRRTRVGAPLCSPNTGIDDRDTAAACRTNPTSRTIPLHVLADRIDIVWKQNVVDMAAMQGTEDKN